MLLRLTKASGIAAVTVVVVAITVALFVCRQVEKSLSVATVTGDAFREWPINLRTPAGAPEPWSSLYDLGVTDLNNDGQFEVFTTNHGATQAILSVDGQGEFTDVTGELGLHQNPEFPNFVNRYTEPPTPGDPSGLYIYRLENSFILTAHRVEEDISIGGRVAMPFPSLVEMGSGFKVYTGDRQRPFDEIDRRHKDLHFMVQHDGNLALGLSNSFAVWTFVLHRSVPLNKVFVGPLRVHPPVSHVHSNPA